MLKSLNVLYGLYPVWNHCPKGIRGDTFEIRLENYCQEDSQNDLSMTSKDIYAGEMTFSYAASMPGNFSCTVIVASHGFDKDRLAFTFTRFDMGDNCGPGQTWLSVMDIRDIYGKLVLIRKKAPCSENQYKCDGERCINSSLICQGHNPCGDGSDCKITPSPDSVVLVVMLGSGGVAVLGIIYKCLMTCLNDSKCKNQSQSGETEQDDNSNNITSTRSNATEQPSSPQRMNQEMPELQENEPNAQNGRRGNDILHGPVVRPSSARRNIQNDWMEGTSDILHIPTDPLLISQHALIPDFDYSDAPPNYESLDINVNNFILNEIPLENNATQDSSGDSFCRLADLHENEPPPPSYEFALNNTEESNVAYSNVIEEGFNAYDYERRNEGQNDSAQVIYPIRHIACSNAAEEQRVNNDIPAELTHVYQSDHSEELESNTGRHFQVFAQDEIRDLNFGDSDIPPISISLDNVDPSSAHNAPHANAINVHRGNSCHNVDALQKYQPPPPDYELVLNYREEYDVTEV